MTRNDSGRRGPLVPLWVALLLAAASGFVLDAAFPELGVWPLAFVGIALVLIALVGRRAGSALLVGFVAGVSFYMVHVPWMALFVRDPTPWFAISIFEALFVAVGALFIALAYRWLPRAFPTRLGTTALLPVVVAGLWITREGISATWPFGGFSWGRMSFSQSEGPLAQLFPWLGASGVSFVMVALVAAAIEAARLATATDRVRAGAFVAAVAVASVLVPAFPVQIDGTMRVAAVQGNGKAAYYDGASSTELIDAQIAASRELIGEDIDVVVWPEGSTRRDPALDARTAFAFTDVSETLGAPLAVGTITQRGDEVFNTSIVWDASEGQLDYYDKRHPVPFGEYVPLRSLLEPLAPDLIGLVQREYTPGTTDPVAVVSGVTVGLNICFDIVDDALLRETVRDGAEIVFAQSNNADFGDSDESVQQLAIARIRALETGRSIVVASTVGQSEIIGPLGQTISSVPRYTAATMLEDVPLSTTVTPAVAIGASIEWVAGAFGLFALAMSRVLSSARVSEARRTWASRRSEG